VWHASVAAHGGGDPARREVLARRALAGVGDPSAGEWPEDGRRAFHLRRRLAPDEEELVGPAVDVRGTPEAAQRLARATRWLLQAGPAAMAMAMEEAEGA
jgi:hypothetical protein